MMKMILNKKKEVFEKKVFKDYIESREKMNMEELDDMISKKRGIMMGKMGE
jgi:exoribonuclease R